MTWYYKGNELTDEMIPAKAAGFIYIITHSPTSRRYIGRKLLTKAHRRQKNNKIIRTRVESDWREYWSSSPEVKQLVEQEGTDNFVREILMFADTKGQLNYLEEKFLYCVGALESEHWLNSNIRSKMYKRNILNKLDTVELSTVLHSINNK
jgi:Putative endonuclease segE, GIY-YIG domain